MIVLLKRFSYTEVCTRGVLHIGDHRFQTIERPWVSSLLGPGGTPFESCIPDGIYTLSPYTRPSGKQSYILTSSPKGVFAQAEDRDPKGKGRYLILIHPGNTVDDVVGCIAPGMDGQPEFVGSSRVAMLEIIKLLGDEEHTIRISPKGTD